MPPKVHDTRPSAEEIEAIETETAVNARRIVATYAENYFDGVTLMCMLGVEPEGLIHSKVAEEVKAEEEKATKEPAKKAAKKAPAKKATKTTAKKTAAKKTTAKKTTAKKTTAKKATKKTTSAE